MHHRFVLLLGLTGSLACSLAGSPGRAATITIAPGFDLLAAPNYQTNLPYANPPQQITSVPVPLAAYDFGGGPVSVGTASWIDERLMPLVLPNSGDSATTPLHSLARQAKSLQVVQYSDVIPGATGSGIIWQERNRGAPTSGSLTVTRTSDTGGTFMESVTAQSNFYDGSPTGALIGTFPSSTVNISGTWQTTPPPGGLVIPGVNDDNFFITEATGVGPYSPNIPLSSASAVPEPSSVVLVLIGLGPLAGYHWRRRTASVA